jgi:hypothetical protein
MQYDGKLLKRTQLKGGAKRGVHAGTARADAHSPNLHCSGGRPHTGAQTLAVSATPCHATHHALTVRSERALAQCR